MIFVLKILIEGFKIFFVVFLFKFFFVGILFRFLLVLVLFFVFCELLLKFVCIMFLSFFLVIVFLFLCWWFDKFIIKFWILLLLIRLSFFFEGKRIFFLGFNFVEVIIIKSVGFLCIMIVLWKSFCFFFFYI